MNLADMRTALRSRIGSPSAADVPDGNLTGHINDACQEVLNKYKFLRARKLARFTTTIGQDKYDVSAVTDTVLKVWDRTNGRELKKRTQNFSSTHDFNATGLQPPVNGKPTSYLRYESYLQIWPPPDGAYEVEFLYKLRYTPLVDDADTSTLPPSWHRGVVILASNMYYDDEGHDPTKALYHLTAWKQWVSDQPLEIQEELQDLDSGVEIPSLQRGRSDRRPDGVWWDRLP